MPTSRSCTSGATPRPWPAARYALLSWSRRPAAEPLDVISEQGARELLADAQAVLGRGAAPA
jgi:hypothetical protein